MMVKGLKGTELEWVTEQRKKLKKVSFFWLQVYVWFGREKTPKEIALKKEACCEAIRRHETILPKL